MTLTPSGRDGFTEFMKSTTRFEVSIAFAPLASSTAKPAAESPL